ncbi:uncharacterized protein [Oryctolagus cuniculus]|uniref:uncharacterized protein isoform X3 n=1 Tax=Oryctolagus cuniculus TaxID=9986 RepID=UPI0038796891
MRQINSQHGCAFIPTTEEFTIFTKEKSIDMNRQIILTPCCSHMRWNERYLQNIDPEGGWPLKIPLFFQHQRWCVSTPKKKCVVDSDSVTAVVTGQDEEPGMSTEEAFLVPGVGTHHKGMKTDGLAGVNLSGRCTPATGAVTRIAASRKEGRKKSNLDSRKTDRNNRVAR